MPRHIEVKQLPLGYSASHALDGESVLVQRSGLLTPEDGAKLYSYLDGVTSEHAEVFKQFGISPSQVDHFLAVIRPDRSADVYCNELAKICRIRNNRVCKDGMKSGEMIFQNDVADLDCLELRDSNNKAVQIPDDCGYCFILSHHWRRAIVFDYSVLPPNPHRRTERVSRVFGHALSRLIFQEMHSANEAQWSRLFEWGWFPFVGLTHDHRQQLLSWANTDRYPFKLLEEICRGFVASLEDRVAVWQQRHDLVAHHTGFLTAALERFRAGDNVSCISVLYPRIEGLMRMLYGLENPGQKVDQEEMVANLVENQYSGSLLLPQRFGEYLHAVYFQSFNLSRGELPLSRHTLAHGVSLSGDYDYIRAAVGFMIFDQICQYLSD